MRKLIVILAVLLTACSNKNAQGNATTTDCQQITTELTAQKDSVQLLYNDALGRLDSITGDNIKLNNLLKTRDAEILLLKKRR